MSFKKKEMKRKKIPARKKEVAPADVSLAESELSENLWSVVSFEECIASKLKYDDAMIKMAELSTQHVAGLCIITDYAAARIGN